MTPSGASLPGVVRTCIHCYRVAPALMETQTRFIETQTAACAVQYVGGTRGAGAGRACAPSVLSMLRVGQAVLHCTLQLLQLTSSTVDTTLPNTSPTLRQPSSMIVLTLPCTCSAAAASGTGMGAVLRCGGDGGLARHASAGTAARNTHDGRGGHPDIARPHGVPLTVRSVRGAHSGVPERP